MQRESIDRIADAVLYEGYILYPYRPSVNNHKRWTFGGLYPRAHAEGHDESVSWAMQTQCLVAGSENATIEVIVRFLHLTARTVREIVPPMSDWPCEGEPESRPVESMRVGDRLFHTWQEAVEREVHVAELNLEELRTHGGHADFAFAESRVVEPIRDDTGRYAGVIVRQQHGIRGVVTLSAQRVADGLFRLTVRIENHTPVDDRDGASNDEAVLHSLASTHTLLGVHDGEFVSLLDPPEPWREIAAGCENVGAWPVLVGVEGSRDTMLSAPIILYDYPQIAPESPGDLFDGTEIDEILTLRILTMTDEEKAAACEVDERARELLVRTQALGEEDLLRLHGTIRTMQPLERIGGTEPQLKPGARVRLCPHRNADILDIILRGKTATVVALETDFENRTHVVVTVDDDPGNDLGAEGKPGHRFFFHPDEVELLGEENRIGS